MPRRSNRFTVYDMMEARGLFEANPANVDGRDSEGSPTYKGPVAYPKMMFHPDGAEKIVVPAEIIATPFGPKAVGEQREIIWQLANNAAEEKKLAAEGWHTHPARAIEASGKVPPTTGAGQQISELESQVAALQAQLAKARKAEAPSGNGLGISKSAAAAAA